MARSFAIGLAVASAIVAAPAAAQPSQTPTAQWFTGTWSDSPDCRDTVRFQADGRFIVVANGAEGRWRIEGNVMVLSAGSAAEQRMPMERLDQNRARATQTGVISYRCEGPNNTRSQ